MARGSYSRSLRWYKGSVYRMNACVAVAQIAPAHSPAEAIGRADSALTADGPGMEPLEEAIPRIHFNRGDGDGRVNLTDQP
jgi:hypothetical protein